ncbi:MAG: hypothetical protein AAGF57_07590 [Pseudomonadota bacterium]
MSTESKAGSALLWIFALIGAVGSLTALYDWLNKPSVSLSAYVQAGTYSIDPKLRAAIERNLGNSTEFWDSDGQVAQLLSESFPDLSGYSLGSTVRSIRDAYHGNWEAEVGDISRIGQRYYHYVEATVTNDGRKPASEVTLDLHENGIAIIQDGDNSIGPIEFKEAIRVGTVRPKSSVFITAWIEDYSLLRYDEFLLGYSDGLGEIEWDTPPPTTEDMVRTFVIAFLGILLILALISLIGSIRERYKVAAKNSEHDKAPVEGNSEEPPSET